MIDTTKFKPNAKFLNTYIKHGEALLADGNEKYIIDWIASYKNELALEFKKLIDDRDEEVLEIISDESPVIDTGSEIDTDNDAFLTWCMLAYVRYDYHLIHEEIESLTGN